jgi:hypothetical protein
MKFAPAETARQQRSNARIQPVWAQQQGSAGLGTLGGQTASFGPASDSDTVAQQ